MNTVLNIYAKVHSEAGCEYDWNKSILIFILHWMWWKENNMLETFPGLTNISFYEQEKEKDLRRMSHIFIPCFD